MDKSSLEKRPLTKRARAVLGLCEEMGYLDIWRTTHPGEKDLTFYSSVRKSGSRIDNFVIPKSNLSLVTSRSIVNITISDHGPVFLQLLLEGSIPSTKMWKFDSVIW